MHILCWGKSPCYLYQKVKLKHNLQRQKSVEKTMHFGLMITLPVTSVLLFVKGLQALFHVLSHLTDPAQREGGSLIYGWSIIIGGLYKQSRLAFHLQRGLKSYFALILQWALRINVMLIWNNPLLYWLRDFKFLCLDGQILCTMS